MKKIVPIVLLVSVILAGYSQDYIPLLEENKNWVVSKYEGIANPQEPFLKGGYLLHFSGDTIINGKLYKKLYKRNLAGSMVPCGPPPNNLENCFLYEIPYRVTSKSLLALLYEDITEKKVFLCESANCLEPDVVLFDFSLEAGDTLNQYLFETITQGWPSISGTVDSVTTEFIYGQSRKVLHTYGFGIWLSGDRYASPIKIVEGVGILNLGLFNVPERELREFCEGSFQECQVTFTSTGDIDLQNVIIGPSPASTKISLYTDFELHKIELLNLVGQKVLEKQEVKSTNHSLDVSNLSNGIYLLNVYNKKGQRGTRKVLVSK